MTDLGWAPITARAGVTAYTIYTQHVFLQNQDVTAPATAASSRHPLPFDETNNSNAGIAIGNTGGPCETVSVRVRTSNRTVTQGSFIIPAQGHYSFSFDEVNSPVGSAIANAVNGVHVISRL